MSVNRRIVVYDTTLRDGAPGPAVSFSAADKARIAHALDELGFDYVEGGFPGSNPKDEELFAALNENPLKQARLAAFGATRRANGRCEAVRRYGRLSARATRGRSEPSCRPRPARTWPWWRSRWPTASASAAS